MLVLLFILTIIKKREINFYCYLTVRVTDLENSLRVLYCNRNHCADLDRLDKLANRDDRQNGEHRELDR